MCEAEFNGAIGYTPVDEVVVIFPLENRGAYCATRTGALSTAKHRCRRGPWHPACRQLQSLQQPRADNEPCTKARSPA